MKNIKPILVAIFSLSFATPACDVEDRGDALDEDELREDALEGPEAQPAGLPTPIALSDRGEPVGFDEERQIYLYDADGDTWPDVTEREAGTDLLDPSSQPGPDPDASFPAATCRAGFVQQGARLCILEDPQPAATWAAAISTCRNQISRVCTYEDLTYLYFNSNDDTEYDPMNKWLGDTAGNNHALYGDRIVNVNNDPDIYNFDGVDFRTVSKAYWCCHDDDSN